MDIKEQKRLNEMVQSHWCMRGRHKIAKDLIKKHLLMNRKVGIKILDIGCSGGYALEFWKEFGEAYGFDISFYALKSYKKKELKVVCADATQTPLMLSAF